MILHSANRLSYNFRHLTANQRISFVSVRSSAVNPSVEAHTAGAVNVTGEHPSATTRTYFIMERGRPCSDAVLRERNSSPLTSRPKPQKRPPQDGYTDRHKRRVKRKLMDTAAEYGINLGHPESSQNSPSPGEVSQMLDDSNISLLKYQKLTGIAPNLPKAYSVKAERRRLNSNISIENIENQGVRRRLHDVLSSMGPSVRSGPSNTVRVKLSGDGAPVGKFKNFVNLSVSLPDETTVAKRQPRLIGVSTAKETYENLCIILKEMSSEIEELQENGMLVNGEQIRFTFYLGADYKLLLCVCGMKCANSGNACIYCDVPKAGYGKGVGNARSGYAPKQPGVARKWLLPMIPVERTVIDALHMYLRTTDRLLLLIRREIPESKAQQFVDMLCGKITCRGRIIASDGKVEFSNLVKSDRKKIIAYLTESDCLTRFLSSRGESIRTLLREFQSVMETVTYSSNPDIIRCETASFRIHFLRIFQSQSVTPYLHILFFHCHEIVTRIGCSLNTFTQQQVEKLNHVVTSSYFSTTNFRDGERQVLLQHGRRLLNFQP